MSKLRAFFEGLWQLAQAGLGRDTRQISDVFPLSTEPSNREMDADLVRDLADSRDPLDAEQWSGLVDAHAKFLESGGTGGRWELLSVSGLPMCIYTGAEGRRGEQAVLRLKNVAGVDARGAWLSWADMSGAYAAGADFSGANLSGSVLIDSWFEEASFQGARMHDVDLSGAKLVGADFRNADLNGADFECTDCTGADFRDANLEGTRFPGATLEAVRY
ncbi:MAG: pentapeptide repeat-containing protein [Myxococcota bacterium]